MRLRLPFEGDYPLTQRFGEDVPFYAPQGYPQGHPGLDYGLPVGTPVLAAAAGHVTFTGMSAEHPGRGNCIVLEHPALDVKTYYLHLSKILVFPGFIVAAGGLIGESGNTGLSTGPHLHFGVESGGNGFIDPQPLLEE